MLRKLIFTTLFLINLKVIQSTDFTDWVILSSVIQVIWVAITSKEILELDKSGNKNISRFLTFNEISFYLLVVDIIIIVLSLSFAFRILFFVGLYIPTYLIFIISFVFLTISFIGNYYVIISYLIKQTKSKIKRFLLVFASLFYPIGVWLINIE